MPVRSDRLVFENAPVGPTKRQVYVRCDGGRGRWTPATASRV